MVHCVKHLLQKFDELRSSYKMPDVAVHVCDLSAQVEK